MQYLLWTLQATVVLQSIGYLSQSFLGETTIFEFFFLVADLPEAPSLFLARGGAALVVAAAFGLCLRRLPILGYLVAGWFAFTAAASAPLGGEPFYRLGLASDAVRYLAPVALVWLPATDRISLDDRSTTWTLRLLAVAAAATFIAHGWEALQLHPRFVDYLLIASRWLFGWSLAQATASDILLVIGAVDVLLGIAILVGLRSRVVFAYMAFWGALTATARMVHGGLGAYPSTLVRAANAGVPFALFVSMVYVDVERDDETDSSRQP